ncbi:MAG: hypothetical protein K2G41_08420 [Duncaniella sp.]|uniref:hypothetical protein n=1 Tax=Duncaniella sp. TaxID=2518496 RepID=UPI0023C9EDB0|nr:hypothetical protein [Duncaniella sp.]MDE6090713.1 hypothetical protein [Duncaniella sp.]
MIRLLISLSLLLWSAAVTAGGSELPKLIEEKVIDGTPRISTTVNGYDTAAEVMERMQLLPLHSVEGLWRFAAEGTLMAIEREDSDDPARDEAGAVTYRMVIVRAADMSLRPGTVMGYLSPTAKRGVYDGRIYTGRTDSGTALHSPKKVTLTLGDDESRLVISRYGSSLRFNWWRLLPYMYRRLITKQEKSPGDIDGCLRVFPAPAIPTEPRYL